MGGCGNKEKRKEYLLMQIQNGEWVIKIQGQSKKPDVEWRFLVQTRILTASKYTLLKVVDSDVFEFGNRVDPLIVSVNSQINYIKLELCYINQVLQRKKL